MKQNFNIKCNENYIEVKKIDILRNAEQNILVVLKGDFWGFGCPNDAQSHPAG